MIAGRESMSDEQWMQLGAQVDDDEYYRLFKQAFAVDIAP
jgi:hypothetical protein